MNSTPSFLEPGNPILGVFAFLDALPPESIPKMDGLSGMLFRGNAEEKERKEIADLINRTFRLQWNECPLRQFLAKYRLYYRDDMADALAAAYCLHKRGGDAETALNADYAVSGRGLYYHENLDDYRNAPIVDGIYASYWRRISPFYEEGDRIVYQSGGGYSYRLLVRGDRLVWSEEALRMHITARSLKREAEVAHFNALGGPKAFLNGEFTWPPPHWVNPVTDGEEEASLKKCFRGYLAEAQPKD